MYCSSTYHIFTSRYRRNVLYACLGGFDFDSVALPERFEGGNPEEDSGVVTLPVVLERYAIHI